MSDTKTGPATPGETNQAPAPRFAFGTPGAGWRQGVWQQPTRSGDTEPPKAA